MAKGKSSFTMYCDWKETFEALPPEKAGELIVHIMRYVNDEDPTSDDVLINAVFAPIKATLKRDLKKWEAKCARNRENVRKRWNTTVYERIPPFTKNTDSDSDSDSDRDINKKSKIPDWFEFLQYALKHQPNVMQSHLRAKYDSWVANKWRDGHDKLIKNWQTKLRNTLPYLKTSSKKSDNDIETGF